MRDTALVTQNRDQIKTNVRDIVVTRTSNSLLWRWFANIRYILDPADLQKEAKYVNKVTEMQYAITKGLRPHGFVSLE